jgi:hypothetical protein
MDMADVPSEKKQTSAKLNRAIRGVISGISTFWSRQMSEVHTRQQELHQKSFQMVWSIPGPEYNDILYLTQQPTNSMPAWRPVATYINSQCISWQKVLFEF